MSYSLPNVFHHFSNACNFRLKRARERNQVILAASRYEIGKPTRIQFNIDFQNFTGWLTGSTDSSVGTVESFEGNRSVHFQIH